MRTPKNTYREAYDDAVAAAGTAPPTLSAGTSTVFSGDLEFELHGFEFTLSNAGYAFSAAHAIVTAIRGYLARYRDYNNRSEELVHREARFIMLSAITHLSRNSYDARGMIKNLEQDLPPESIFPADTPMPDPVPIINKHRRPLTESDRAALRAAMEKRQRKALKRKQL